LILLMQSQSVFSQGKMKLIDKHATEETKNHGGPKCY
jgi:hypothetical protein